MEIKIEPNRLASLSKRMMEHQNRTRNLQNSLEREAGKMTSLLWQSEFPPPFTGQITGQNDMINQTSQRIVNTLEYQAAWLSYFAHKASGADGAPFSLKQAEAVLAKYDERFRKPEKSKGLDKKKLAKDAAGELSGVYDVERAATGIDPATGEKLSGMDRVFSSGMVILGVTPFGKGYKAFKVARTADKAYSLVQDGKKVKKVVESADVVKDTDNVIKDIDKIDYGAYLKKNKGNPPSDMFDPHAHHIVFKKGNGKAQKELVQEGQEILKEFDIDPILGLENLVWAPNRVKGQHGIEALTNVVDNLKNVRDAGGDRDDMVEMLEKLGEVAKRRK